MKRSGRPRSQDRLARAAAVALLSSEGSSPGLIAKELELTASETSKLAALATSRGLMTKRIELGPGWGSGHESAATQLLGRSTVPLRVVLQRAGEARLITPPLTVRVFPTTIADWPDRLAEFGRASAGYVRKLIQSAASVGFSWGETLYGVCRGVERLSTPGSTPQRLIRMFPICGEPLAGLSSHSASMLASRFSEAINGTALHVPSLASIPFMVPLNFRDDAPLNGGWLSEVDTIKKLAGRVSAQIEIFGDRFGSSRPTRRRPRKRAWIDDVSMIVTSVGQQDLPFGRIEDEVLESSGLNRASLRAIAAAEIAGVILPKPEAELSSADGRRIERIQNHWLGLSIESLARCAERARRNGASSPSAMGVVVVALGASKASAVLECMCRYGGLVTHLVCDGELEARLRVLLDSQLRLVETTASPSSTRPSNASGK
jgi:DNA-binding transcriptional regulator LsrR (DeoR family)